MEKFGYFSFLVNHFTDLDWQVGASLGSASAGTKTVSDDKAVNYFEQGCGTMLMVWRLSVKTNSCNRALVRFIFSLDTSLCSSCLCWL